MNTYFIRIVLTAALLAFPAIIPHLAFANETNEPKKLDTKYLPKLVDKDDFEQRIIDNVPFAEELQPVWHLVKGDVDVFIPNLRVDRANKGLIYKTSYVPFIGAMDGVELKFKAGEEMKFSFESSHIPFMGQLEGFNIKGSIGEESSIFARYTIPLD